MTAEEALAGAIFRLSVEMPYLATGLWSIRRVPVPGLGAIGVTKTWILFYDPDLILSYSKSEVVGIVYHELNHLLRDHADRGEPFQDPFWWNVATDAEINDDADWALQGFGKLPMGCILPEHLEMPNGLLAEQYYQPSPSHGESVGVSPGFGGRGSCGSCSGGNDPDGLDLGDRAEGITKLEAELVRRMVAHSIEAFDGQGWCPASMRRWARDLLKPQVNWRNELGATIRNAIARASGCVDYSYQRPSRRQSAAGNVILPSLVSPIPNVAIVVDTSGSISVANLEQSLSEVQSVLETVGARFGVTVLAVDAAVHSCKRITKVRDVDLIGGGGTNMGVGIEAASRLRPRPSLCIVCTDGFTPWPQEQPMGLPCVVVMLDRQGRCPRWAKRIDLTPAVGGSR